MTKRNEMLEMTKQSEVFGRTVISRPMLNLELRKLSLPITYVIIEVITAVLEITKNRTDQPELA
jgi:hypothetical protein